MAWIYQVINVALTVAAAIATLGVHTKRLRTLYGGMTVFLLINAISSGTAAWMIRRQRAHRHVVRPRLVFALSGLRDLGGAMARAR